MKNKVYIAKRNKEIDSILKKAIAFLDSEEIKQEFLKKIMEVYRPEIPPITKKITDHIIYDVERSINTELKELAKQALDRAMDERIHEMINEELDRRFRSLLNEYDY